MFPNVNSYLLTIDDPTNDSSNPSCLINRKGFQYEDSINSSLTILSKSLQSNELYQFMILMENIYNSSKQATGYVLVKVEDTRPQLIAIGCVIITMCSPNLEYQFINPTTQVALFSLCIGNCSSIQNITWNIYSGQMNSSVANYSQWNLFNPTQNYFFGRNTSNFTSTNQLFLNHPEIKLWKFEVVYSFRSETSISSLNFLINQPPSNGSCSIFPLNGTITTSFEIICSNWFDEDGIKDYSVSISSLNLMIAFSSVSTFQIQLPSGDEQTGLIHLTISIRDQLNSVTEFNNLSSVVVRSDSSVMNDLLTNQQNSNNRIVELLSNGNQNTISQVLTSVSNQLNKINEQSLTKAASNGIPTSTISISSLGSQRLTTTNQQEFNQSALIEFTKDLNSQSNAREYLISFTKDLQITTSNSIKLQSSTLSQLTKSTNQLTRTTLSFAVEKCLQLTDALVSIQTKVSFEDIQIISTNLIESLSNLQTAVNGPLQQRTTILNSDKSRSNQFPTDYDTDLESEWSKVNLLEEKNVYFQKQLSNQIQIQINEIQTKLISIFQIHLNVEQQTFINSSQVFMFLQTQSIESLSNKQIEQIANASIRLPSEFQSNLTQHSIVSIRSMIEPLAPFGKSQLSSNTNLSTSISLSILDQNGNQISIQTKQTNPIEIFIPRDPNLLIPRMILQNVTNRTEHQQLFNLHYVNLTSSLSISVHLEFLSVNEKNVSYLLIYKFDQIPQLNQIDGWTILCHLNQTNISTYFLDNQQTRNHRSLVFGLRELTENQSLNYCYNSQQINPPMIQQPFHFTSNYLLRIYTSGCYYLDENNEWKDDGLTVGPLTNHFQTQCFSNHL